MPNRLAPGSPWEGVFAHGVSEPARFVLHRDWSFLSTGVHGEMSDGPLEGFFAAGTQFFTHYRIRVEGIDLLHTFRASTSADSWAGIFSVPSSAEEEDLPGGGCRKADWKSASSGAWRARGGNR